MNTPTKSSRTRHSSSSSPRRTINGAIDNSSKRSRVLENNLFHRSGNNVESSSNATSKYGHGLGGAPETTTLGASDGKSCARVDREPMELS